MDSGGGGAEMTSLVGHTALGLPETAEHEIGNSSQAGE